MFANKTAMCENENTILCRCYVSTHWKGATIVKIIILPTKNKFLSKIAFNLVNKNIKNLGYKRAINRTCIYLTSSNYDVQFECCESFVLEGLLHVCFASSTTTMS